MTDIKETMIMNERHPLIFFLAIINVILVVLAEIAAWAVIPASIPASARFTSPLIFLATAVVLFPVYKRLDGLLSLDLRKVSGEEKMRKSLDTMGKVPLKALCMFFPLNAALFVIYSVVVCVAFGAATQMTVYAVMTFSLALIGGAYLYIYSDILITSILKKRHFKDYPLSLRYKRQALKLVIVPVTTMVLGIAATMSGELFVTFRTFAEYYASASIMPLMMQVLPFPIVFVIPTASMAVIWSRATSGHYSSVTAQLDTMISEEKDLTERIEITSIDEIAEIATRINAFTDSLHGMVKEISESAVAMDAAAATLADHAESISGGISTIAKDIADLNFAAEEQSASVTETSSTITQIVRNIESLAAKIERQASAVTQSSAAVQEMVSNIVSVSESLQKASSGFEELKADAESGKGSIGAVNVLVSKFAEQSASLLEANNVIKSIAAQTNLLAMNAAIEAAHAGEAGAGFAVVADEIRKLAESSSNQSKTIATGLKDAVASIETIATATSIADGAFDSVSERINSVASLVSEIALAMSEQSAGSRQVLEALRDIENVTGEIRGGAVEMNDDAESILGEVTRLSGVSQAVHDRSSSIAKATEGISDAVAEIARNAGSNKEAIDTLVGITGKFKV